MKIARRAPAKINLGLQVLRRREDGYHEIRSLMLPIAWYDRLIVRSGSGLAFTCSDPALPAGPENLCWRAARILADTLERTADVEIRLEKRIPAGAGLGGGSSDAAAVLRACADLWEVSHADRILPRVAAEVGSDVPFFLNPRLSLIEGRGERVTPIEGGLQDAYHWVVVVPGVRVATSEAYRWVSPRAEDRVDPVELVRSTGLSRWKHQLVNDFEDPVGERLPVLGRIRARLREEGAGFVSLTGSGSGMYGGFEDRDRARSAADRLRSEEAWTVWVGPAHDRARD